MQDDAEISAEERERQAWAEFWELVGQAAYQLWKERRVGDAAQDAA